MNGLRFLAFVTCAIGMTVPTAQAADSWPLVDQVERQPLLAQVQRLQDAMRHIGAPFTPETAAALQESMTLKDDAALVARVQELLDPYCVAAITIRDQGGPAIVPRGDSVALEAQGWKAYLVKVVNPAELRSRVRVASPNAKPLPHSPADEVASRWLGLSMFDGQPLAPNLSGLPLEYRIVEIFARDAGERLARLEFAAPLPKSSGGLAGDWIVADWRFDDDTAGWTAQNQIELEARDGALSVRGIGDDPFMGVSLPEPVPAGKYVLRFWAKADEDGVGQLFWSTTERPEPSGNHSVSFNVESGHEMMYEVPISADGPLAGIRLDPNGKPFRWRIDWIELSKADGGSDWSGADFRFSTRPSNVVTFRVIDDADRPAMACFEITDEAGRVYPPQTKRLAPDFFFQKQIYRADGETVQLPAGNYKIVCSRGPETRVETQTLTVTDGPAEIEYRVRRWVDPSRRGYWSGDHHIHAAGCAHYENPTQGVNPPDMLRHCMGEDLKVGCCLTWGPCFDFQKRFFTGKPDDTSQYPYLIRYDIEVSGFGSHASGHLNLLRLTEQIPPGGDSKDHWPSLGLNTLRWAKRQGAVCGPAHSASGLTRYVDRVPGTEGRDGEYDLPTFNVPAFDGIGANEFIMNVAHEIPGPDGDPVPAVDFISTMNTERNAEFNMWYHVLNCGFRVRASGETDFPCITGERVGIGRVYVRLDGELDFDRWCDALAAGRSYVSNGRSHLMEFTAAAKSRPDAVLESGTRESELHLAGPEEVVFEVVAAAMNDDHRPTKVELIVNGYPVAEQEIRSDGEEQTVRFEHPIDASSWVAMRTYPSAHTNPVFVIVDEKPIRANRDSARWCLMGLEQCWKSKARTYRQDERETAERDYAVARDVFEKILADHP